MEQNHRGYVLHLERDGYVACKSTARGMTRIPTMKNDLHEAMSFLDRMFGKSKPVAIAERISCTCAGLGIHKDWADIKGLVIPIRISKESAGYQCPKCSRPSNYPVFHHAQKEEAQGQA